VAIFPPETLKMLANTKVYCLRFLMSTTKNYLNEKSGGYFSAGNAKNARQYKSIACAF